MLKTSLYSFFFVILFSYLSFAQMPDKFTNLKVFPKDISKEELGGIMRSFTGALGVRCSFCHVEEEGQPDDFASDLKSSKQKARIMIKMTSDINNKSLSALKEYSDDVLEVKCVTCHRGVKVPEPLEDLLLKS